MKSLNVKDIPLSNNFWLHEFIVSSDHPELLPEIWENLTPAHITKCHSLANLYLQPIRDRFGVPIITLSGIRSPNLNIKVGGSHNSIHLFLGFDAAVDFTVRGSRELLWRIFYYIQEHFVFGELVIYLDDRKNPRFLHLALPNPKNHMEVLVKHGKKFHSWKEWTALK